MKKFRMMLPMVAFVFAAMGAVAGNFLPGINAYYTVGAGCSTNQKLTEQSNCETDRETNNPICTVKDGVNHPQAFADSGCTQALRYVLP